jgi:hypothetical protein
MKAAFWLDSFKARGSEPFEREKRLALHFAK